MSPDQQPYPSQPASRRPGFRPAAWRRARIATAGVAWLCLSSIAGPAGSPAAAGEPAEPLAVAEVASGVFVHQGQYGLFTPRNSGDVSNCSFVIGAQAVAVIDTCGSFKLGGRLLAAIRARTPLPVRYVINTHMHPDHVFGNAAFEGEKPRFAGHKKLGRALAARAERYLSANKDLLGAEAFEGTRIVLPDMPVEDKTELDLGGRVLVLVARPTAHTDNDLTVLDKETGTLFAGDLLFSVHVPALDGSIRGWLAVLGKMASEPAARVVPGHGPASMPWPEALEPEMRYLSRVAGDVRAAIKAGRTLADTAKSAGESERGSWQLFDEFNARNVSAAFAELEWE